MKREIKEEEANGYNVHYLLKWVLKQSVLDRTRLYWVERRCGFFLLGPVFLLSVPSSNQPRGGEEEEEEAGKIQQDEDHQLLPSRSFPLSLSLVVHADARAPSLTYTSCCIPRSHAHTSIRADVQHQYSPHDNEMIIKSLMNTYLQTLSLSSYDKCLRVVNNHWWLYFISIFFPPALLGVFHSSLLWYCWFWVHGDLTS